MGWFKNILSRKTDPAMRSMFATVTPDQARWTPDNYAALMEAGYKNCSPVYACVNAIVKPASRLSWYLTDKNGDEVEDHPLLALLDRPNETESGIRFTEKVFSFYLLAGNSYVVRVKGLDSLPPQYLYTLRPDRMKIVPGSPSNPIAFYEYSVGGSAPTRFKPADILHLMEFNPLDDWYGLSKLRVVAREIDILNESMEWNKRLLQNDMRPSGVLNFKQDLTPEQRDALRRQIEGGHVGASGAGRFLITEGEASWEQMSTSPKDMDWTQSQLRTLRSVCAALGVDPSLCGDSEYSTYSNKREARRGLYLETILPLADIWRDELNAWLVPSFGDGLRLDYDRDAIEEIQEDRGAKYTYLATADWLKVNEKREATGYDELTPEEGGEAVMVPMGQVPLTDAVLPAGEATPPVDEGGDDSSEEDPDATDDQNDALDEDEDGKSFKPCQTKSLGSFWRGETERKALWRNFEKRVAVKERAFARELKAWLGGQAKHIAELAATGNALPEAQFRADSEASYKSKFSARYKRLYGTALAAGRRMTEGKLYEFEEGKAIEDIPPALRAKLEKLIADAAKVITDETVAEIQAVLLEATGSNLTTAEIAGALRDKVDGLSGVRSRRIARTETAMLENAGNLEGYKENEFVNKKGWGCEFLPTSREAHMAAHGQEVGIDEPFILDGPNGPKELQYPGDRTNLGPGDGAYTIECKCYHYPIVD